MRRWLFTILAVVSLLLCVFLSVSYWRSQQIGKSSVNVGTIADFANVGVNEKFKSSGFYVVHLPDNTLVALDTASTHLGCITNWLPKEQKFKNPCNGSLYDLHGINRTGADPRPLERYRIYVHGGQVVVDKTVKFRSELGEWDSSSAFIEVPALESNEDGERFRTGPTRRQAMTSIKGDIPSPSVA